MWKKEICPSAEEVERRIYKAATEPMENLFQAFGTLPIGLTEELVRRRTASRRRADFVRRDAGTGKRGYVRLWINPLNGVLVLLLVVALLLEVCFPLSVCRGGWGAVAVLSGQLVLNILCLLPGVWRGDVAAERLWSRTGRRVYVRRAGAAAFEAVASEAVVEGDIVVLRPGDILPADLRLTRSERLFVVQYVLTGEKEPVKKFRVSRGILHTDRPQVEWENVAYMGSVVASGKGEGIVFATGYDTLLGSRQLQRSLRMALAFGRGGFRLLVLALRFLLVLLPFALLLCGFMGGDWVAVMLGGASLVAVGLFLIEF